MRIRLNDAARRKSSAVLLPVCALLLCAAGARAQQPTQRREGPPPPIVVPSQRGTTLPPAAPVTDLFCAGFIEHTSPAIQMEVVGGEQEQERRNFAVGDFVFIDAGASGGVSVGREFAVVRPRGRFKSKFTAKDGSLGVFTQVVGRGRVTEVKGQVSVALVTGLCGDAILFGDVLRDVRTPATPPDRAGVPLERFADSNGRQQGRIVMARDSREMVTRNQIVYIDLGGEDNVKAGDLLTIFRPAGTGTVTRIENEEITQNKRDHYGSERFRGGPFSNKAQRAKDPNGGGLSDQEPVTSKEVKKRRPAVPRKIVGELVVLSVEARTATALITRVAQEIHTGDYVELQ